MGVDIRLPVGLLFVLLGALLVCFGLASGKEIYQRCLGINVNLWWGLVQLAFGLVMLLPALGGGRSARQAGGQQKPL